MSQKISILGIDIAKLVFHVVGMDHTGHVVLRKGIVNLTGISAEWGYWVGR